MTISKINSLSPYFDDFDPAKDYVRVLFRPGYPVQARELTTLQTFLQEQIGRFGDYFFKNGSIIRNTEIDVIQDSNEFILSGSNNASFPSSGAISSAILGTIANLEGKIITNSSGTIKARVLPSPNNVDTTKNVGNLYVRYLTSETFDSDGGYIYAKIEDNPGQTVTYYNTFSSINPATIASVEGGVYYVNNIFTNISSQSIVLSNSTRTPSVNVGFSVTETAITQNDDPSLFDNARGSTNEGAPGAHRLKLALSLSVKAIDAAPDSTFYRVITLINGSRQEVNYVDDVYAQLADVLARRTYDESGNYVLKPFTVSLNSGDSDTNFGLTLGASKAYVQGYEIDKRNSTNLYINRGLDSKLTRNFATPIVGTTSVEVQSVVGSLPGTQGGNPFAATNRLILKDDSDFIIGIARAYAIIDELKRSQAVTELYLYDIKMFTQLDVNEPSFIPFLSTGNDVQSFKTRGYVYKEDDSDTRNPSYLTVINTTGKFITNKGITSSVTDSEAFITDIKSYGLTQVSKIQNRDGSFTATVTLNSVNNENSSLIHSLQKHLKTLKASDTTIIDNDFKVIENIGSTATAINAANGYWDLKTLNDQEEIEKTLRYAYVKIKNESNRTGVNYGWIASDKEVSLHFPDVHRVYQVNETINNTFATGRFKRLNITTAGVLPQGTILTGKTSGSKCVVALMNGKNINQSYLGDNTNYHQTQEATGSNSVVEVIFTKGTNFTLGEYLEAEVPGEFNPYLIQILYNSVQENQVGENITNSFMLDDGQRNEFYDIGRLVRKDSSPEPVNDIIVFYSYFQADPTTNHYYSVDSYSKDNFFRVDPRFYEGNSQEIVKKSTNSGIDLRNSFDFRLRVKEPTAIANSPFNFSTREFWNQDKILPDSTFTSDFYEFIGRVDSIYLNKNAEFIVQGGVPSVNPEKPSEPQDSMPIAHLTIPPATRYPEEEIIVETVDNRRYTMKDISILDQRITNLENFVSLSLLESQALLDDVEGRTKSGFTVDDFSTPYSQNTPSDPSHPEFNVSVNTLSKTLIPSQTSGTPIGMEVSSTTGMSDYFPGYFIKDFVQEIFNDQKNATTSHPINPFGSWNYNGDIVLTPSQDNWFIQANDYFENLYGDLKPFENDPVEFNKFNKISTRKPEGSSSVFKEWVGNDFKVTSNELGETSSIFSASKNISKLSLNYSKTLKDSTSITSANNEVYENPQNYYMRSITVGFKAANLRPNSTHIAMFGDEVVATDLITDNDGYVSGSFTIPAMRFRTGTQTFRIIGNTGTNSSNATVTFKSTGFRDQFERSDESYENFEQPVDLGSVSKTAKSIIEELNAKNILGDIRSISNSTQLTVKDKTYSAVNTQNNSKIYDINNQTVDGILSSNNILTNGSAISQMFKLPKDPTNNSLDRESSILTSIDLWFAEIDKRTGMNQVCVEIRESINGYPGTAKNTIGSTGYVKIDNNLAVTSISNSNAVNLKFRKPVLLRGDREYAIVIKTPSDKNKVWIGEIGETLLDGTGIHTSQPNVGGYYGSFFLTQNQISWVAEQSKDLTYRLYRANFDVNGDGVVDASSITFTNKIQDSGYNLGDIGAYNNGLALETYENSNYVKVYHPNHGMNYNNAQVTISGFEEKVYNGIHDSELNKTHKIWYPTIDSYFVKTNDYAAKSGRIVGPIFNVFATQDIVYDSILTNFMINQENSDHISMQLKTVDTNSVNLEVSGNKLVNPNITNPFTNSFIFAPVDKFVEFETPKIIRSQTNADGNDLTLQLTLNSGSRYTSPFFRAENNISPIVFRNLIGKLPTDSEIEGLTTLLPDSDDDIMQEFISRKSAIQAENEQAAYVTKQIDLKIPADGITIYFEADMEPSSSITASYKAVRLGEQTNFEEMGWIDFPSSQIINETNYSQFSSETDFQSYTMRVDVPYEFVSLKVRLRMKTDNEAQIPKIKNLRIISDI